LKEKKDEFGREKSRSAPLAEEKERVTGGMRYRKSAKKGKGGAGKKVFNHKKFVRRGCPVKKCGRPGERGGRSTVEGIGLPGLLDLMLSNSARPVSEAER